MLHPLTPVASLQDCKQFQGELFGICNLFRDLSDKLFTSEIIELHEKQGREQENHNAKQDTTDLVTYFLPSLGTGKMSSSVSDDLNKDNSVKLVPDDFGEFVYPIILILYIPSLNHIVYTYLISTILYIPSVSVIFGSTYGSV